MTILVTTERLNEIRALIQLWLKKVCFSERSSALLGN